MPPLLIGRMRLYALRVLTAMLLGLVLLTSPVTAQDGVDETATVSVPDFPSPDAIDQFLAAIDDEAVRQTLRDLLMADLSASNGTRPSESIFRQYQAAFSALGRAAGSIGGTLGDISHQFWSIQHGVPFLLILMLTGALGAIAARRLLGTLRRQLIPQASVRIRQRVWRGLAVSVIEAAELLAFIVAAWIVFLVLGDGSERATAIAGIAIHLAVRFYTVLIFARFVLAPHRPQMRLTVLTDGAARAIFMASMIVAAAVLAATLVTETLYALGLTAEELLLANVIVSTIVILLLLIAPWVLRRRVADHISRSLSPESGARALLRFWPAPINVYVLLIWVYTMDLLIRRDQPALDAFLLSLLGFVALVTIAHSICVLLERSLRLEPADVDGAVVSGDGTALNRVIAPTTARLTKSIWISFAFLGIWLLAQIYDIRMTAIVGLEGIAEGAFAQIIVIVLLSYVGFAVLAALIDRHLANLPQTKADTRAKRMRTLLPLLRSFLMVVILVMVTLTVLASLGVDIGPLIAGAGVIGLAIGLGAQSLVTDIVAGVFFLVDDAFAVGDYIETGGLRGTVESISLRSLKLRHHRGAVHTIPFGQMASLTNYSRDWVIVKLEFRVSPETDLTLVKKLVKRIGADLLAHEELGPNFLEPLKSQGVRRFEDSAMIIGVKFMSIPGEQFVIRREIFQRIRDAFKENGIELVDKGVVVRVGSQEEIGPAVTAAAAAAVAEQEAEANRGGGPDSR